MSRTAGAEAISAATLRCSKRNALRMSPDDAHARTTIETAHASGARLSQPIASSSSRAARPPSPTCAHASNAACNSR
eukprot:3234490-Pleurochrysis_carterae.AAC.1